MTTHPLPDNVLDFGAAKPTFTVTPVDPDTARRWLGYNVKNRKITSSTWTRYARDMAAGNWQFTGEPIKFDTNGNLIDGQHRLLAIIDSGTTVLLPVVRGLQSRSQDVMDTGRKRSAADMLAMHGRENVSLLAAAAKWAILFDREQLYVDRKLRHVTHADILEYTQDNAVLREAITCADTVRKQIDMRPSLLAASIYLTSRVDADASHEFYGRLADGVGLEEGSPILALRSRLRQIKDNRAGVEPEAILSLNLRAWNAWRDSRRLTAIPLYRGQASIRCPQPR